MCLCDSLSDFRDIGMWRQTYHTMEQNWNLSIAFSHLQKVLFIPSKLHSILILYNLPFLFPSLLSSTTKSTHMASAISCLPEHYLISLAVSFPNMSVYLWYTGSNYIFLSLHWILFNEMTRVKWDLSHSKIHRHWIGKYICAKRNLMCKFIDLARGELSLRHRKWGWMIRLQGREPGAFERWVHHLRKWEWWGRLECKGCR
jgi:hypothetical protein